MINRINHRLTIAISHSNGLGKLVVLTLALAIGLIAAGSSHAYAATEPSDHTVYPNSLTSTNTSKPPGSNDDFSATSHTAVAVGTAAADQSGVLDHQYYLYNNSNPPDTGLACIHTSTVPFNKCNKNFGNNGQGGIAWRSEGLNEKWSSFEIYVPTVIANAQPTVVDIVDACKNLKDNNGWEDHRIGADSSEKQPVTQTMTAYAKQTVVSGGWYGADLNGPQTPDATCTGGNDLKVSIPGNFFQADPRYPNVSTAAVIVKDSNDNDSKKFFTAHVGQYGPFVFVDALNTSPADASKAMPGSTYDVSPVDHRQSITMFNHSADYFYNPYGPCYPGYPSKANPYNANCLSGDPGQGGYSSVNQQNNSEAPQSSVYNPNGTPKAFPHDGINHYDFYFSPDNSYPVDSQCNGTKDVYIKWDRSVRPTQEDSETWTLSDVSPGGTPGLPMTWPVADWGDNAAKDIGHLIRGHVYHWEFNNVDRAHGITVWLPFSQFTASSGFAAAACPKPYTPTVSLDDLACNVDITGTAEDTSNPGNTSISVAAQYSTDGSNWNWYPTGSSSAVTYATDSNHRFDIPMDKNLWDGNDYQIRVFYYGDPGLTNKVKTMPGCAPFITKGSSRVDLTPSEEDPSNYATNSKATVEYAHYDSSGALVAGDNTPSTFDPEIDLTCDIYFAYNPNPSTPPYAGPSNSNTCKFQKGKLTVPDPSALTTSLNEKSGSVNMPIAAGDNYCGAITLWKSGLVDKNGNILSHDSNSWYSGCATITNKPFFKTFNSGVSAGGDFQGTGDTCGANGILASWNRNSGTYPVGASTQIGAVSLSQIVGVASNQPQGVTTTGGATGLTFANIGSGVDASGSTTSSSDPSQNLGGNFGSCHTISDPTPANLLPDDGGGSQNVQSINDSNSGSFTQPLSAAQVSLQGTTTGISPGKGVTIFANGDVYISSNITYNQPLGGWSIGNVPSFVLHAAGNIYVDPGVTELDGIYIAKGNIYTCGTGSFQPVGNTNSADYYTVCKNQLKVVGSFVAKHVNLMRAFGSLRDEKPTPGTPAQPGATSKLVFSCGGSTCNPPLPSSCVSLNEPSEDPLHTWTDNQLCLPDADSSGGHMRLKFTYAGGSTAATAEAVTGLPVCAPFNFVNNAPWNTSVFYTWGDNWICSDALISTSPTDVTSLTTFCTAITEPADTAGNNVWNSHVYVCVPKYQAPTGTTPPTITSCSSAGGTWMETSGNKKNCAGESFDSSPELYLGRPSFQPSCGTANCYDSIVSLPPVL